MAEDKSSSSSRKTMAPAARPPAGADERDELEGMDDRELDELAADIARERRRRGRVAREPSFGMSEGERDELERTGRTVSPFTGERRGDWPENNRG